jgi:hypothetical protein
MRSAPRPVAAFAGFADLAGLTGSVGSALRAGAAALVGALLLNTLMTSAAQAAPPQVNLTVSWRLDDAGRDSSTRQVVQGQVIIDSRGNVVGRTGLGATTVETERSQQTEQMLQVLNGQQARLFVGKQVGRQSWQIVWSPQSSGGAGGGASTGSAQGGSYGVQSQTTHVDLGDGLVVRPRWAGGRQPVLLDIEARSSRALNPGSSLGSGFEPDGQVGRTEVSTTLALPLGQWTVIARSGDARTSEGSSGGSSLSTRSLDEQGGMSLSVRVSTAGIAP